MKQVPQQVPQMQMHGQVPHMMHLRKEGPRMQHMGKEMPRLPVHRKDLPYMHHYGKELPQMHVFGKDVMPQKEAKEQRRLRGAMIEICKIMRSVDRVDRKKIFPLMKGSVTGGINL
eukprot:g41310.t1